MRCVFDVMYNDVPKFSLDLPNIPRVGDTIQLSEFIGEKELAMVEEKHPYWISGEAQITYCCLSKDDKGTYYRISIAPEDWPVSSELLQYEV